MHFLWIVVISSILMSFGVLMVTSGKSQAITFSKEQQQKLSFVLEQVTSQQTHADVIKDALEDLVTKRNAKLKALGAEVEKLESEQQKKKAEVDTCRVEKEAKQPELEELDQTMKSLKETLKAESDVWSRDKETLEGQLTGYREVCKYVKNSTTALKMCGTPPSLKTIPQQR